MWSPTIASELRRRGHDAVAVKERDDLISKPDALLLAVAWTERRAIVTNNVRDFRPLAAVAIADGRGHAGLIVTSDHSLPRRDPRTIGQVVIRLDALLTENPGLTNREIWL
jgi:hypothetical protein